MVLVWFSNLKFLPRACHPCDRNFKSTTLGPLLSAARSRAKLSLRRVRRSSTARGSGAARRSASTPSCTCARCSRLRQSCPSPGSRWVTPRAFSRPKSTRKSGRFKRSSISRITSSVSIVRGLGKASCRRRCGATREPSGIGTRGIGRWVGNAAFEDFVIAITLHQPGAKIRDRTVRKAQTLRRDTLNLPMTSDARGPIIRQAAMAGRCAQIMCSNPRARGKETLEERTLLTVTSEAYPQSRRVECACVRSPDWSGREQPDGHHR